MDREATIDYMFGIRAEREFAPMAVIHLPDGTGIAILMLWDEDTKYPMIDAMATLAGGLGAEKIEMMNDAWVSKPEGYEKHGLPRNDPDRTEAMMLTEVWHDKHHMTCIPYTETENGIVRGEPYEGTLGGNMLDALRFGLIAGREGSIPTEVLMSAAERLNIDLDSILEE